jgi:3,4-dihydroxy-9,10-secoandrosta-1,3,5(10)-triene-9,17-dione 4,5-dioxygenase
MAKVNALGYLGIGARDLDAWEEFARTVLGMEASREKEENGEPVLYLRMDERHHRIAVRPGEDEVTCVGWEAATVDDLLALVQDIEAAGTACEENPGLARRRGVHRLFTCTDPAGITLELHTGALVPKTPFASPTAARFVTKEPSGKELGLGHVVFECANPEETMAFYLDVLGFRVSDYIVPAPGFHITFLHTNARHHSYAAAGSPQVPRTAANHFMVEVDSVDAVGRALDKARALPGTEATTLGRHTNDHMLSFYMKSPSGFGIEYGTAGRLIDDATWNVVTYDASEYWGHQPAGPLPERAVPPAPAD